MLAKGKQFDLRLLGPREHEGVRGLDVDEELLDVLGPVVEHVSNLQLCSQHSVGWHQTLGIQ